MRRLSDRGNIGAAHQMARVAEQAPTPLPPTSSNVKSAFSISSILSFGCISSIGSFFSLVSLFSAGSVLSIGSVGSVLSIGSNGSVLSIGSIGSILSIGAAGGILRIGGRGNLPDGHENPPRRWRRRAGLTSRLASRARRANVGR